jgi:hypothetical protein
MNSIRLNDHGRSLLEQIKELHDGKKAGKKEQVIPQALKHLQDVFEKTATPATEKNATGANDKTPESIQTEGLNISFQFDLFYELTSKVEAKMGQKGAERFVELSGTVSETFMGNFSLSIDAVGSFMNGTDKSLDISPEVTNEFFDAVEGLADLSPEALENFLKESNEFFAELEKTYGPADGAFDQIKNTMQEQAKAFFADVETARQEALAAPAQPAVTPELPATEAPPAVQVSADTPEGEQLIELLFQPDKKIGQQEYKNFLEEFWNYAEKFRQQMLEKLFSNRNQGYSSQSKAADESGPAANSTIDTAV